jgi:uncharacterized protein
MMTEAASASTAGVALSPEMIATAPLGLLVIQPSPFCNIDCSYCYLADRGERQRMSTDTIEAVVRYLGGMVFARSALSVVWHAGEPLVLPIPFYEQAFDRFAHGSLRIPVQHHFQTNATLIDDEWCQFIKRAAVRVGVSIDGPKHIHDAHRVDRAGRGTFDQVMRGISKLHEHRIPFTIIGVITRAVVDRPDEVWNFLSSLQPLQLAFNIEEAEGVHQRSSLAGPDLAISVRRFFSRIAELQAEHPELPVRELEDMRRHLSAPPGSEVMRANNRPGAILNIDVAGNVTTLSPELLGQVHARYGKFAWANVHSHSFQGLIKDYRFLRVQQDVETGVRKCANSCGYFGICGGGNPSNKLAELGTLTGTETQHCRLHVQAVADVVLERMEREHAMLDATRVRRGFRSTRLSEVAGQHEETARK